MIYEELNERLHRHTLHSFHSYFSKPYFLHQLDEASYLKQPVMDALYTIACAIAKETMLDKPGHQTTLSYSLEDNPNLFLSTLTVQVSKVETDEPTVYVNGAYHIQSGGLIQPSTQRMKPITVDITIYIPRVTLIDHITTSIEKEIFIALSHEIMHAYEDYQSEKKTGKSVYSYTSPYTVHRNIASSLMNGNHPDTLVRELAYIPYFIHRLEQNAFIASMVDELHHKYPQFHSVYEVEEAIQQTEAYQNFLYITDFIYGYHTFQDHSLLVRLQARETYHTFHTLEPILLQLFHTNWKPNSHHTPEQWNTWIVACWHRVSQRFQQATIQAAERYYLETL